jgi:hypothetical protein
MTCRNCTLNPSEVGSLCRPCYQYQYRHGKPRPKTLRERQAERDYRRFVEWAEVQRIRRMVNG